LVFCAALVISKESRLFFPELVIIIRLYESNIAVGSLEAPHTCFLHDASTQARMCLHEEHEFW
jgi:hypothetical protein